MANEFKARNGIITPFIQSTVATGTAPFIVASTTLVSNLNVQYLNGQVGSYYLDLGNATGSLSVSNLTGTLPVTSGGTGVTTSTGSGSNVLNTSPTFITSLVTSSTSFDLLNTTATTINFGGVATTLNIGSASATNKITSINDSTSTTIGALTVAGGVGIAKNLNVGSVAYIGPSAYSTTLTNPALVIKNSGATYTQAALLNTSATGSSDWAAYADNGSDVAGWSDMGVTSSGFNDANYTITGKNDGYFFVQSVVGAGLSGNMVLATGGNGTTNDIIFGTGGFLSTDEKMRFIHASGQLYIKTTTTSTSTSTGALRVAGGVGIAGAVFVGGTVTAPTFSGALSGTASLATNIAGGVANQIPYQTSTGTTSFIPAPTTSSTSLTWNGSAYTWAAGGGFSSTDDTATNASYYPVIATTAGGSTAKTSSTKLYFNPSTGVLSSTGFNSLSDISLKENIVSIESGSILHYINPVEFTWKDTGVKAYGVIAQEIEKVLPELVETNIDTGIKSVAYTQLIPFMLAAIKDLSNKVEELTSKLVDA